MTTSDRLRMRRKIMTAVVVAVACWLSFHAGRHSRNAEVRFAHEMYNAMQTVAVGALKQIPPADACTKEADPRWERKP